MISDNRATGKSLPARMSGESVFSGRGLPYAWVTMNHSETWIKADDGTRLFSQSWVPEPVTRSGIVLVHGFGDHSGRYGELVLKLTSAGFPVFAFDLRGHGRSSGRRGHILAWQEYRSDLSRFLDGLCEQDMTPSFLFGHSMGGLIVLDFLLGGDPRDSTIEVKLRESIEGVVLSAPLLAQPGVPAWRLKVAALLSQVWPVFSLRAGIDPATLSRSEGEREGYREDPLVHGTGSARLATELISTQARIFEWADRLQTSILLCHGTGDRLVSIAGSRRLAAAAPSGLVELKEYSGACHELHNDLVKEKYFGDVLRWIERGSEGKGV